MAKYNQETKDKAVELAKQGVALKAIQTQLGPNPKATMRYLVKAGIDYNELKEQLKAEGKLQTATKKNTKGREADALKAEAQKNSKPKKNSKAKVETYEEIVQVDE